MEQTDGFNGALKEARVVETARIEALFAVNDARVLRLELLRELILPHLGGPAGGQALFGLWLQEGDLPRLWIDLTASVVMAPNPRSYRVIEMVQGGQEILHESEDATEVREFVLRHLARRQLLSALRPADWTWKPDFRAALETGLMWTGAVAMLFAAFVAVALYCGWMTVRFG